MADTIKETTTTVEQPQQPGIIAPVLAGTGAAAVTGLAAAHAIHSEKSVGNKLEKAYDKLDRAQAKLDTRTAAVDTMLSGNNGLSPERVALKRENALRKETTAFGTAEARVESLESVRGINAEKGFVAALKRPVALLREGTTGTKLAILIPTVAVGAYVTSKLFDKSQGQAR